MWVSYVFCTGFKLITRKVVQLVAHVHTCNLHLTHSLPSTFLFIVAFMFILELSDAKILSTYSELFTHWFSPILENF